jgi:hypothetical protein
MYAGYIIVLSPNQIPTIDAFIVAKLLGQKAEDPYVVNAAFEAVWNCMGFYPAIYGALLIPAARSNKVSGYELCC